MNEKILTILETMERIEKMIQMISKMSADKNKSNTYNYLRKYKAKLYEEAEELCGKTKEVYIDNLKKSKKNMEVTNNETTNQQQSI